VALTESFEPYDQSVLEVTKAKENTRPDRSVESSEKGSEKSSEKTEVRIMERLRNAPGMTISDLAEELELSTRAIEKQLQRLQNSGRLRRMGPDKGGHWEVLK